MMRETWCDLRLFSHFIHGKRSAWYHMLIAYTMHHNHLQMPDVELFEGEALWQPSFAHADKTMHNCTLRTAAHQLKVFAGKQKKKRRSREKEVKQKKKEMKKTQ